MADELGVTISNTRNWMKGLGWIHILNEINTMPKVGDWVSLKVLPPWIEKLPKESQAVFKFCVGRTYLVSEIDEYGHFVLDVSPDVDKQFGGFMNDIRVEEKYIGKPSAKEETV